MDINRSRTRKNYSNTTYGYTPNPLKYIDPLGTDTLNITYSENRWKFDKPILAKGNDVFNVTINNQTESYTFSEGEYGKRVNFLNLYIGENKSDYALGIYHVSGEQENGTGYYVTPGGYPSTVIGSGRRIPEGTYPIITPASGATWRKPGVGGNVSNRGIRFHYGSGNARGWTEGCFVLSSDYTISGGKVQYNLNESKKASQNFDKILGASHYDYKIPARNGTTKTRNGSRFYTSISHKLILKSRTK